MRAFCVATPLLAVLASSASAQLLYPPQITPSLSAYDQAVGDVQLRQAYDTAASGLVYSGSWQSTFGGAGLTVSES
jgi:hypothetical protein